MLYSESYGDSSSPPLLLLHGFLGDHHDWAGIIPTLSKQYFCIAVDLPGHGQSSIPPQYTWNDWHTDVATLLDQYGIKSTHILGYSMGGRLALSFARSMPQRCQSLFLESTHPGLTTDTDRQHRIAADAVTAAEICANFTQFLDGWYTRPMWGALRTQPGFDDILRRRLAQNPTALAQALTTFGLGKQPDFREFLGSVPFEIRLMAGEKDAKFTDIARSLVTLYPYIHHTIIPEGYHNCHAMRPETFCEWVLKLQIR